MKLLVIGGTEFVGRAFVEAALAAGHEMTLFHRGRTNPGLFPEAEHVLGDRDGGLDVLEGRTWDAALDTCAYVPRLAGDAAQLLADAVDRYTFVSTCSVYPDEATPGVDEFAPLWDPAPFADTEDVTDESYGPLKVLCERAVLDACGERSTLIVRPGYIVGPHDSTDRFTSYLVRAARGGRFLAPGPPELLVQVIDVRDLGDWMLRCVEGGTIGVFNAVGPAPSMAEVLDLSVSTSGRAAEPVWVDADFLLEQGADKELPMWHPRPAESGVMRFDPAKALAAGLELRPIATTIQDTLAWRMPLLESSPVQAGLTPERERALLDAWASRTG
ncbi:MAG: NAD-dependent epimerase/dehydratase family protein [Actinomycetota bacterium]